MLLRWVLATSLVLAAANFAVITCRFLPNSGTTPETAILISLRLFDVTLAFSVIQMIVVVRLCRVLGDRWSIVVYASSMLLPFISLMVLLVGPRVG